MAFYSYPVSVRENTKTTRKDARRNVRNALGTTAEAAPGLIAALDAADSLRRIIDLASNGRYGLAIVRPTFEGETTQLRRVEDYTFNGTYNGAVVEGEKQPERSSQIHEPVSETRRREKYLRDVAQQAGRYAEYA